MRALWTIALLAPALVKAQVPTAVLDTSTMRIGEQVAITLAIDLPGEAPSNSLIWPTIGDTLTRTVEVVGTHRVDTVREGSGVRLSQRIILTSFDTGHWAIPPFAFAVDGRVVETRPLLLEVRTATLDAPPVPRPLRGIHEVPFSVWHWMRVHWFWIAIGIGAVLVILLVLFYLTRLRKAPVVEAVLPPLEPAHVRTLRALRDLDGSRLWQQGEHKAYHSRITDLLRGYIEERYAVPAMESSTDELLQELRVSPLNSEQRTHLENMLRLADLVKFAKALPTPAENEQMMAGAIRFVEATAFIPTANVHAA